jgi:hypothetical protein
VVSFTPWPLYSQVKSPWYPLDRRLGGPQSRSGRGGEEKHSHTLYAIPLSCPVSVGMQRENEINEDERSHTENSLYMED